MIQSDLPRQTNNQSVSALLSLCVALVAVSFAPIFVRFSETSLGASGTIFNRMLIFLLCFGLGQAIRRSVSSPPAETPLQPPITHNQWLLLTVVGIASATTLVLWAVALQYTSVAKCMLLNNLTPVFTSLGAWLFLGKRFDRRFLIGMLIALAGAIGLGFEDLQSAEGNLIGDFYSLLSAVFLGGYFLVAEQLRSRFSAATILLWRCTLGAALLFPIVLLTEGQLFPTTWLAWLGALGLGLVSEGLGQRLIVECMDQLSAGFVSLFLLLEPLVSAMLAWIIFAEQLSPITWLGFAVILSGIYLAKSSSASATAAATATAEVKVAAEVEEAI